MKHLLYLIVLLTFNFLTFSCQKTSLTVSSDDSHCISGVNLISFFAECDGSDFLADVSTKAVSEVKTLESFFVVATTGAQGSEKNAWSETLFSQSGTSSVYTADKYWPITDPEYHFYASNVSMTSSTACKVQGNSDKDIVCAYLDKPVHKSQNSLSFHHIYSRIGQVSINTQEGYLISGISVSISCPVSGTYDIYSGNGKTDGTGWSPSTYQDIALNNGANDVYVVPGKYKLEVAYTLSKGEWTKSFEKTADVTLEKGKISTLSGTATGGDASDIQFTVSLSEWQSSQISVIWD